LAFQRITNVVERSAAGEAARLRIVHGPDAGLDVRLPGAGVVVGADTGCDVALRDPAVSARHVAIAPVPDGFDVEDLGSRNGTFLDGVRIGRARVAIGATLHVGATAIQLIPAERPHLIEPSTAQSFGDLLGASRAMRSVYALLERASQVTSPVLLTGESGTGKELAARAIHAHSARRTGPFVVFDCGAASEALLTSDLFGHARGAFTGAHAERVGAFAAADGGTLFLDEIGELPLALQPKLLRMVESGEVTPLGTQTAARHDVRIVAATHRELWREVASGGFRGDLYYRLAVIEVRMPALRARREDIPALAAALLARAGVTAPPTGTGVARLMAYGWPGNVRELRNVIARAVALAPGAAFEDMPILLAPAAHHPPSPTDGVDLDRPWADVKSEVVDALEHAYFERLLERHGDNLTEAARIAGLERKYLYRVMQRLNLSRGLRRDRD
jgi:DNA-binding NtrC family response regulator